MALLADIQTAPCSICSALRRVPKPLFYTLCRAPRYYWLFGTTDLDRMFYHGHNHLFRFMETVVLIWF